MGGTTSMLYSGAVEAAVGTIVSSGFSSVASKYEMQEELDVTLYSLKQEVIKIRCAINAARGRRITDQELLMWLGMLINAAYRGDYTHRTFTNRKSSLLESECTSNFAISPFYRAAKRIRTILPCHGEEFGELHGVLRMLTSIDVCVFLQLVNGQPEICRPVKTYLYMDHNRMFGREQEREEVMKFLFEPNMVGGGNVDILPIVGCGKDHSCPSLLP